MVRKGEMVGGQSENAEAQTGSIGGKEQNQQNFCCSLYVAYPHAHGWKSLVWNRIVESDV